MFDSKYKISRIQKLIAERMLESKLTKPCFYLSTKVDISELMAIRPKLRKSLGVKITTNSFYIRALALAVKKYPLMAGRFLNDHIELVDHINVGFAVNAPQGLVVPVIKNVDKKSLSEIALEEKPLIDKARDNKLTLDDINSETVALSNLGAYGTDSFLGIVPLPTTTILTVGNIFRNVVFQNGQKIICKMINLSIAVDGRVVNEFYAARFLHFIREMLHQPELLA